MVRRVGVGPVTGSFIRVDGAQLEVKRCPGKKRPVLLLHEGLGSVSMWRDFPDRLASVTGHEVICWSRRGYGFSDPFPGAREPDYMHREADLLPEVIRALGLEDAHLFGHSDGASIALIAASRFPHLVASLVLEAPHVFVEEITLQGIRVAKTLFLNSDIGSKLSRHHADAEVMFWQWNDIWLDHRFRTWNIENYLGEITAPVLLMQGIDDEYGTLIQLDRIEACVARTTRVVLQNCGHSPHRDHPLAVLQSTARFLQRADG